MYHWSRSGSRNPLALLPKTGSPVDTERVFGDHRFCECGYEWTHSIRKAFARRVRANRLKLNASFAAEGQNIRTGTLPEPEFNEAISKAG
jgi:hypothetical protein